MLKKKTKTLAPSKKSLDIRKARDIEHHRSFVFYGRSGTGKTTLAATFPLPALLIDINDRGTDSISDTEVDVAQIDKWETFDDLYWQLKSGELQYKTVIIDTVSGLQELAIRDIVGEPKEGKNVGDWGTMTKQQWGTVAGVMKSMITRFRDLPMDVVFLAQDRAFNFEEEEGETAANMIMPEVGPQLMPSVAKHLNAAVFVIGNTYIRQRIVEKEVNGKNVKKPVKEYCLRIGPDSVYITKVRKNKSTRLPDAIADPSYEAIMEIITGD